MKHLVLLLLLALGGYFLWYYLNHREKVWATILLKRHVLSVVAIVAIFSGALFFQANIHSTKIL